MKILKRKSFKTDTFKMFWIELRKKIQHSSIDMKINIIHANCKHEVQLNSHLHHLKTTWNVNVVFIQKKILYNHRYVLCSFGIETKDNEQNLSDTYITIVSANNVLFDVVQKMFDGHSFKIINFISKVGQQNHCEIIYSKISLN